MSNRWIARLLAPLALFAAVAAIYYVGKPEFESLTKKANATETSTSTTPKKKTKSTAKKKSTKATEKKKKPKIYTVKSGDNLGVIAERTGVSIARLRDYNELADAETLSVGQKLKLAR